jgi:hypothetical protein
MRTIQVLVSLNVEDEADVSELIAEMDYSFTHPAIIDTDIIDVYTEV